jgi:N-methylhydantoinase B
MRKTAMSAIIYEVLDMGTGITTRVAHRLLRRRHPGLHGVLDKSVKAILRKFPIWRHPSGDVFATNDPFYGGVTHLNDVIFAMPVFVDGEIVAWTANIAHWNDIGGMTPGSMSTEAVQIFQEGLRLPAIKVIEGRRQSVGHGHHDREFAASRLSPWRHVGGDRRGAHRRAAAG